MLQELERLDPLLPIDATFPLFIAAEPSGVTGLIIAGIFARPCPRCRASSTAWPRCCRWTLRQLVKNPTEKGTSPVDDGAGGPVGMALALVLSRYDIHSLFDVSIELAGCSAAVSRARTRWHVHSPRQLEGRGDRHRRQHRADAAGVVVRPGASYFYLGISIMLCIARHRQPVPAARPLARGTDDPQPGLTGGCERWHWARGTV